MPKSKTISFNEEIDDTIVIMMKQKSSEYLISHNNILRCKCPFCHAIVESFDKIGR